MTELPDKNCILSSNSFIELSVDVSVPLNRVVGAPLVVIVGKVFSWTQAPWSPNMPRIVPFGHVVMVGCCNSAEQFETVEAISVV